MRSHGENRTAALYSVFRCLPLTLAKLSRTALYNHVCHSRTLEGYKRWPNTGSDMKLSLWHMDPHGHNMYVSRRHTLGPNILTLNTQHFSHAVNRRVRTRCDVPPYTVLNDTPFCVLATGFTGASSCPQHRILLLKCFYPSVCKPANTDSLLKCFHENQLTFHWGIMQRKGKAISHSLQPDDDVDDDDDDDDDDDVDEVQFWNTQLSNSPSTSFPLNRFPISTVMFAGARP